MAQNLVQWDRGITILDWWRPLGAILGHFGVILELRARGWGLFGAYFSPIWLDKMTWMALNLVQWDKVLPHLTGGGHCRPFWSDFEPFWVAKWVKDILQTGPSLLLWALKSLKNSPQMAPNDPNGPKWPLKASTSPVWSNIPDLGQFKSFWVAEWVKNRLQTGPILLLWALKSFWNGSQIGPKWPLKASHQSDMVIPCPTIPDSGPFRPFWAQKR